MFLAKSSTIEYACLRIGHVLQHCMHYKIICLRIIIIIIMQRLPGNRTTSLTRFFISGRSSSRWRNLPESVIWSVSSWKGLSTYNNIQK